LLLQAGEDDGLYVVWEGTARAFKAGEPVRPFRGASPRPTRRQAGHAHRRAAQVHDYGEGDHFGELALLGSKFGKPARNASVRAGGGHSRDTAVTHCLRLGADKFGVLSSLAPTLQVAPTPCRADDTHAMCLPSSAGTGGEACGQCLPEFFYFGNASNSSKAVCMPCPAGATCPDAPPRAPSGPRALGQRHGVAFGPA
jgi:hypothetical protein